ncbi:MAG: DUF481 domain-containing protein [Acidobacteriota bacterium]
MKRLSQVLLISGLIVGSVSADVVVMKNGDRVTGTVVKKDGANLTVKTANFGEVTLPWADITNITTDMQVTVELAGGQQIQGPLSTANGQINVGGRTLGLGDVVAVRDYASQVAYQSRLKPGWGQLWAGTGSLSWAGTSGNAKTNTFAVGMSAVRATNSDQTSIYFNAVKASAKIGAADTNTAQAVRGGWSYNRNLTPKLFFTGFNDWEYDKFQALDLRAVFGGGLGYKLLNTEHTKVNVVAGGDFNHAKFDPAPLAKFTRNDAEIYWGGDLDHHLGARSALTAKFRMFNNLSSEGGYRMNFDAGYSTQLFKWLSWNVAFSDRYLSIPAPGRKANDVLYTTGIGVSFSH